MKYYADYTTESLFEGNPGSINSKEIGIFDFFNLRGTSNPLVSIDWNNSLNWRIGGARVLPKITDNCFTQPPETKYDYFVIHQRSRVKIYHYSVVDLTKTAFKLNPFENRNSSYANGCYFYDFYPGEGCGWGKEEDLYVGEYEGDWFKGINEPDSAMHDAYSFVAYDFDKIKWSKPTASDLLTPKMTKDFEDKDYILLLFSIENLIRYGGTLNAEKIEKVLAYPFSYATEQERLKNLQEIKEWVGKLPMSDYRGYIERSVDYQLNKLARKAERKAKTLALFS